MRVPRVLGNASGVIEETLESPGETRGFKEALQVWDDGSGGIL